MLQCELESLDRILSVRSQQSTCRFAARCWVSPARLNAPVRADLGRSLVARWSLALPQRHGATTPATARKRTRAREYDKTDGAKIDRLTDPANSRAAQKNRGSRSSG